MTTHPATRRVAIALSLLPACDADEVERPRQLPPAADRVAAPTEAFCEVVVKGKGSVDLENDYLPHVIQCENGGADLEALKAQAIAARSTAYYYMASEGAVCDSQDCQVYSCGSSPSELHRRAVAETSRQYLAHGGTLTYGFYVAGDTNTHGPSCVGNAGAGTEHWVTYNEGAAGNAVEQTELGWVFPDGAPGSGQNRGCLSQWGSRCLERDRGYDAMEILRFYYGADIEVRQASGTCGGPGGGVQAGGRDVFALVRAGGSGSTEVHVLNAESSFADFSLHAGTALHATNDPRFELAVGDYDGDGRDDLYSIDRHGGSGTTEVHVVGGGGGFQSFLLHAASALHPTDDGNFDFDVGDYNADGRDDLYVFIHNAGGRTEVHVLDAASGFSTFTAHIATALHATDDAARYHLAVGNYDDDSRADLYLVDRAGGSGMTDVHVLSARDDFQSFALHAATGLHNTLGTAFTFAFGDYDRDGRDDLYAIDRAGSSGNTDVHVLTAHDAFSSFALHAVSGLHHTGDDFVFSVGAL